MEMSKSHDDYRYCCCYIDTEPHGFVGYFVTDNLSEALKYLELRGWPDIPSNLNPNVLHGDIYTSRERVLLDSTLFDGTPGSNVIARSSRKKKLFGLF